MKQKTLTVLQQLDIANSRIKELDNRLTDYQKELDNWRQRALDSIRTLNDKYDRYYECMERWKSAYAQYPAIAMSSSTPKRNVH